MTRRAIDREKLRVALRRLSRGHLLVMAERVIELVPRAKLRALVGDFVRLAELAEKKSGAAPLLDEVRKFHEASRRGDYYESFAVNSRTSMQASEGTEEFIAEFDRLVGKCIRASEKTPGPPLREAFELLFGLLRHIDEGDDDVVFFADEGGSWAVGVDWRAALPAYFRCRERRAKGGPARHASGPPVTSPRSHAAIESGLTGQSGGRYQRLSDRRGARPRHRFVHRSFR